MPKEEDDVPEGYIKMQDEGFSPKAKMVHEAPLDHSKGDSILDSSRSRVVIAGAPGTGTRQLLQALAGPDLPDSAMQATGRLDTKYYSATVEYQIVDLKAIEHVETAVLPTGMEAYLLLCDPSRPETFIALKSASKPLTGSRDDEENSDGEAFEDYDEGVRLCISARALDPTSPQGGKTLEELNAADDVARNWSATAGFEFLSCPLGEIDLAALRARRNDSRGGRVVGLMEEDTDGTSLRILEALECHTWPSMELKQRSHGDEPPLGSCAASAPATSTRARVAVAGFRNVGKRALLGALAGGVPEDVSSDVAEMCLDTKYYKAHVTLEAVDFDDNDDVLRTAADIVRAAAGTLFVCKAEDADQMKTIRTLWASLSPVQPSANGGKLMEKGDTECSDSRMMFEPASRVAGFRLFLAVAEGGLCDADCTEWEVECRVWCAENGFEFLRCPLNGPDLDAVKARSRRGGGRGASLLRNEDDDSVAAERIVESLEAHVWAGMEMIVTCSTAAAGCKSAPENDVVPAKPNADAKISSTVPGASGQTSKKKTDTGDDISLEAFERFADDIRNVRGIADDETRRKRACDVAMMLAQALGVDSDSDDCEA